MASIHGKEHPLRDIFSDQFAFTVPSFQRPYAWQTEHLETLSGDVYHSSNSLYILLRLDNALAATDEPIYNYPTTTIEHVLPQNPKPNSEWRKWFPDETERIEFTNCLGNLILLSRPRNSETQNFDFTVKKRKYFVSDKGISTFALTTQVLQEQEWTPEVIKRRQEVLINKLKKI